MSIVYAYRLEHPSNGKGPWNFAIDDNTEIFVGDLRQIQYSWRSAFVPYKMFGVILEKCNNYNLHVFHYAGMITGFTTLDKLFDYFFEFQDLEILFSRAGFVIRKYQVNGRLKIHESSHQIAFDKKASSVIEECPV